MIDNFRRFYVNKVVAKNAHEAEKMIAMLMELFDGMKMKL